MSRREGSVGPTTQLIQGTDYRVGTQKGDASRYEVMESVNRGSSGPRGGSWSVAWRRHLGYAH